MKEVQLVFKETENLAQKHANTDETEFLKKLFTRLFIGFATLNLIFLETA